MRQIANPRRTRLCLLAILAVGAALRLIARDDSIPANWRRPTLGWRPGEIIVDTHTLIIPPMPRLATINSPSVCTMQPACSACR